MPWLKRKEKIQHTKNAARIPRNVMESIPYRSVYKNGIIEDYDGRFSKSYRLKDTSFDTEEEEKQESMVLSYEKLLNCIDDGMIGQLNIINRSIDQDIVRNSILMRPKQDGANDLRAEWNDLFLDKLGNGKNNLAKDKIFTVSVEAPDVLAASDILKRVDHDVARCVRRINRQDTPPLSIEDRLGILHDIYNPVSQIQFGKRITPLLKNGKLDLDLLAAYGMSTKELIAPDSMEFRRSSFLLGDDVYGKAFYLDHLPTALSTSILNDISDLPCNMVISVTIIKINHDKIMEIIKRQSNGMNAQIDQVQANAIKEGISNSGVVSQELLNARDQAQELMSDVMKRNQKVFRVTTLIILFAQSHEELNRQVLMLKSIVNSHLCILRSMNQRMEVSLNTALPLAELQLTKTDRVLTTESSAVFMPFAVQDMNQLDGIYYGDNPISGNMVRYNRKNGQNYNALVVGDSGSGKSFVAKKEILQVFLNTSDRIIIIDPQGEYSGELAERMNATVIDLSLAGKTHINPLDMDIQYGGQGENPIPMKCASIETLIECMIGGEGALSPVEKSIIHRVGQTIYRGYYRHMQEMVKSGITCDKAAMPTLQDFYAELCKQKESAAQYLATAVESYCVGTYRIFSERTNVDTDNRVIVYNVAGMSSGMKELAMHVCMSDAWNRMIENGIHGYYTRLYVDEFHLFTKTRTSANHMKNIYKMARKWRGMPMAITQSISGMLTNEEAAEIVGECSFIIMMKQSPTDRLRLQNMYNISSQLMEYLTDQARGTGLIYNGTTIVPFEGEFPDNTESYRVMDSRMGKDQKTDE